MEVHPDSFVCPILGTLMCDPVVAADGHTYERNAINEWFKNGRTSPMTGLPVGSTALIPNHALRKTIDDYCVGRPDRTAARESSRASVATVVLPVAASMTASSTVNGKALRVQPTMSSEERPPWEFDKKLLATSSFRAKKPVLLSASRTSLYSGEGVIVAFEPTADGKEFNLALNHPLKLEKQYAGDASLSSIERLTDETFVAGTRSGPIAVYKLERNATNGKLSATRLWQSDESSSHTDETTCTAVVSEFNLIETNQDTFSAFLVSGSRDRTVRLWKPTGDRWSLTETLDHRAEVKCVTGFREGHVLSGGADWSIKMWDPHTPDDPVRILDAHSRSVRCVSMEQTGHRLASGSDDENIIIWDPRASDPVVQKIETGSPVITLAWGDNYLCAGGGTAADSMSGSSGELLGGWLRFWDPRTWKILGDATIPAPPRGARAIQSEKMFRHRAAHELATYCLANFDLAGNHAVVSGGDDKQIRIWVSPPYSDDPFSPRPNMAYELGGNNIFPIAVDALATLYV